MYKVKGIDRVFSLAELAEYYSNLDSQSREVQVIYKGDTPFYEDKKDQKQVTYDINDFTVTIPFTQFLIIYDRFDKDWLNRRGDSWYKII